MDDALPDTPTECSHNDIAFHTIIVTSFNL